MYTGKKEHEQEEEELITSSIVKRSRTISGTKQGTCRWFLVEVSTRGRYSGKTRKVMLYPSFRPCIMQIIDSLPQIKKINLKYKKDKKRNFQIVFQKL